MKRIVNGVTYNTDTSTKLAKTEWVDDGNEASSTLYQTRGGAFFVHDEITRDVWNEREQEDEKKVEHSFEPLSPDKAHQWLMTGDVEVFSNPFDDPPEATAEAETSATVYMRVPASLKRRIEDAAKEAGVSGNAWAMRCVESCLGDQGRSLKGEKDIANAYWWLRGITTHWGDGYTNKQVLGLVEEAAKNLESAWVSLGLDHKEGDVGTTLLEHADQVNIETLKRHEPEIFKLYHAEEAR